MSASGDTARSPLVRELIDSRWVMPKDFDRSKQAPPSPLYDGPPEVSFSDWWARES